MIFQFFIMSSFNDIFHPGGFYRHLYEQKMGPKSTVTASESIIELPQDVVEVELSKKPNKGETKKERVYRKRKSSTQGASDDEEIHGIDSTSITKKAHLQSNLDADSDFSIDSDSDEEKKAESDLVSIKHQLTDVPTKDESKSVVTMNENEAKLESVAEEDKAHRNEAIDKDEKSVSTAEPEEPRNGPKIDKKKIWEKRTTGDVLVAAIQRYFERKLLREREG